MAKKKTKVVPPRDRLARLLRDAYIEAYVQHNPFHDAPGWDEVKKLGVAGWEHTAAALLARGVMLPAEDEK